MTIGVRIVQRPNGHYCDGCGRRIEGAHLRLFGMAERCDPPRTIFYCYDCASRGKSSDERMQRAVETIETMAASAPPPT